MQKVSKRICGFTALLLLSTMVFAGYFHVILPDKYYVVEGQDLQLHHKVAITTSGLAEELPTSLYSVAGNSYNLSLALPGGIPIKDVHVQVVQSDMVMVGGFPFGIKMFTDGVMVVGMSDLDQSGKMVNPAKNAGLKVGDIITSIEGEKTTGNEDLKVAVSSSKGESLTLSYTRNGESYDTELLPYATDSGYKCGIWVRDSSAGIGTMTYYNPETGVFGGLGHAICDVDTGGIMPLSSGEAVEVRITGVKKGESGTPGELQGLFAGGTIGNLAINADTGIFGSLSLPPTGTIILPLAMSHEVYQGEATIYTTLEGNEPRSYTVEIEKVYTNQGSTTKNMIVHITDPELLAQTGGIVQGMSGSPLVQNGKLIGAVTHVFVNDPTRGYGIFIENMMETARDIP